MTFDPAILRELTVGLELNGYLRIIPQVRRATPLGTGQGLSRFSSADGGFTPLYAARDLPTAIAERIVRDRYQGRTNSRFIGQPKSAGICGFFANRQLWSRKFRTQIRTQIRTQMTGTLNQTDSQL